MKFSNDEIKKVMKRFLHSNELHDMEVVSNARGISLQQYVEEALMDKLIEGKKNHVGGICIEFMHCDEIKKHGTNEYLEVIEEAVDEISSEADKLEKLWEKEEDIDLEIVDNIKSSCLFISEGIRKKYF